jgi:hypothetical protein
VRASSSRIKAVVFKLSSDEDRDVVSEKYSLRRSTRYLSFTSATAFPGDGQAAHRHPAGRRSIASG